MLLAAQCLHFKPQIGREGKKKSSLLQVVSTTPQTWVLMSEGRMQDKVAQRPLRSWLWSWKDTKDKFCVIRARERFSEDEDHPRVTGNQIWLRKNWHGGEELKNLFKVQIQRRVIAGIVQWKRSCLACTRSWVWFPQPQKWMNGWMNELMESIAGPHTLTEPRNCHSAQCKKLLN